jgi:hypothetical protein
LKKYLIGFELDNAGNSEDLQLTLDSYLSVLQSAQAFASESPEIECEVAVVLSQSLGTDLLDELQQAQRQHRNLTFKLIMNEQGTYFGAKNATVNVADGADSVIFCDSDCLYERDFVSKILSPFSEPKVGVVYGVTYPRLSGDSGFERRASLWWQFPPEEIGYSRVWTTSQWMNNMAARLSLLQAEPFPEVIFQTQEDTNQMQLKVEGVLWKKRLQSKGEAFFASDATAYHRIFSSWDEFNERQLEHGLASAFMSAHENRGPIHNFLAPAGDPVRRLFGLFGLVLKGEIRISTFVASLPLFATSLFWRLRGSWAYRNSSLASTDPHDEKEV